MHAQTAEIGDILAGERQFVIPIFQRFYSWKLPEWQTLWNDIHMLIEERDGYHYHFIGPFITVSRALNFEASTLLVIDGQQRLITLTVLLCALRDKARELGFKDLGDMIETNTIVFMNRKGKKVSKIIPRSRDREIFKRIIDGSLLPKGDDSLLSEAYRFFIKQLSKIGASNSNQYSFPVDSSSEETINSLYRAITKRLRLVLITLDDFDNPSNVYESLNFKGERLQEADLIRNYIFMQVRLDNQEDFDNNIWRGFENVFIENIDIENKKSDDDVLSELTDFYYRYLTSKKGYFTKNRLYQEFMKFVDENYKGGLEELEELINELKRFARYYLRIKNCTAPELELNEAFKRFKALEVDTALPLLLYLYECYENEDHDVRISLSDFLIMLQAIESFLLRRSIMRMRTRGYGLDFAQAIKYASTYENLIMFLASKGWPTDQFISEELKVFPIYRHESKKAFLILSEIERSYGHKEKVNVDNLTIEHIMPQNLSIAWRNVLGSDAENIHTKYVHTIGNLTLTAYNVNLSNDVFQEKKKIYVESKLTLNNYFLDLEEWKMEELLNRSEMLIDQFKKLWPRPKEIDRIGVDTKDFYQQLAFDL